MGLDAHLHDRFRSKHPGVIWHSVIWGTRSTHGHSISLADDIHSWEALNQPYPSGAKGLNASSYLSYPGYLGS